MRVTSLETSDLCRKLAYIQDIEVTVEVFLIRLRLNDDDISNLTKWSDHKHFEDTAQWLTVIYCQIQAFVGYQKFYSK